VPHHAALRWPPPLASSNSGGSSGSSGKLLLLLLSPFCVLWCGGVGDATKWWRGSGRAARAPEVHFYRWEVAIDVLELDQQRGMNRGHV
jgi:hypothetical protein